MRGPLFTDDLADHSIVVCGGGAAGLAAAIAAARHGAQVLLVEAQPQLGGTVAGALIHTLAGLFDDDGCFLNDGLPRELAERLQRADSFCRPRKMGRLWVLAACPNRYRQVVTQWVAQHPRLHVLTHARVAKVVCHDGRIAELQIAAATGAVRLFPRSVIDSTGSAEVARLIDPSLVFDDKRRAAGGWIFRLRGIASGALRFPKGLGIVRKVRDAVSAGTLPALCAHVWIDEGVFADEAFVKLMVPLRTGAAGAQRDDDVVFEALNSQMAFVRFLREVNEFSSAQVTQTGAIGVRDGGRIRGRYTLTGDDVRLGRSFPDGICRCAWPIEYWDPDHGVTMEYLPRGASYQIPLRSLQIAGVRNFWTAGKCLSADRQAHASARVAGACWAMGEAAGRAAAHQMDTTEDSHDAQSLRTISANCAAATR